MRIRPLLLLTLLFAGLTAVFGGLSLAAHGHGAAAAASAGAGAVGVCAAAGLLARGAGGA